ncbi:PAS domain S-box protein [Azospirillum agricola]|uniref:PAS domain S-box protein n=1 Tax=Azospirillum agricola TaxID=1720247 RepID=UPI000A0F2BEE|nr:PAS domain S-box protein [Azospirillum agricola]SMH43243.1 PAS domain S-box-containing protein [Azospirillum lipoferum]
MSDFPYTGEPSSGNTPNGRAERHEEAVRYAAIVEAAPDAIIVFAAEDGRIAAWNAAATRMFGYSVQEAIGAPVTLLLPDPCPEGPAGVFDRALSGDEVRIETVRRHRDGNLVDVSITANRMTAADGRVLGVAAFMRDITDRKAAQAQLQASETKFQAIVDSIDQMIWSTRPDGYHDYFNQRWYEFTGVPPGATEGEAWSGMFHPDDRERAWGMWRQSLDTGEPYHIEYRLRHWSGRYRWVIGRAQPVRDAAGRIVRWYGTCTDVHDLKTTQEALRASEERFRFALDAAGGVGTWNWDVRADSVTADATFASLFGVEPARTAEGLPITAYVAAIHPDDRDMVAAQIARALDDGADYLAEYRVTGLDGKTRWVLARGHCAHDDHGIPTSFPGVVIDITDHKATEEALRIAVERIDLALTSGAILGTWVWDIPVDRFTVDERFARFFALSPQHCQNGLSLDVLMASIHPEDWPSVRQAVASAMETGGAYSAEYRVRQFDGTYRWVEANGHCSLDTLGKPLRFPGVLIDIHKRKQVEKDLRQKEAEATEATRLLRTVIEAVPALIYVKDVDGRIRIANGPVMELIGKPWSEVEGHTDLELLDDKEQGRRIMETDRRIMDGGATEELEEIVGQDERGPRIWLSHKSAFRNEAGQVVGLVGTSIDLTSRKRAEEDRQLLVRELNHRVKNLFAVAVGMVAMTARTSAGVRDMADALTGRLLALARAHDLIRPAVTGETATTDGTTLLELMQAVITPHLVKGSNSLHLDGPHVHAGAAAATSLALTLHELATNAAKYGALSSVQGTLTVSWLIEGGALIVLWQESGGPAVQGPPSRRGFGSQLMHMSIASQLGGRISHEWCSAGLRVALLIPIEKLSH